MNIQRGDIVKIREDIAANENWQGIEVEILELDPIDGNDIRFVPIDEGPSIAKEKESFAFLYFDEVKCRCGNDFLWHDTERKYFCPFCE